MLRAVTVLAHQPTGMDRPITQAHCASPSHCASTIKATQAHSVNESLHLGVFERAAVTEALLLAKLGEPE